MSNVFINSYKDGDFWVFLPLSTNMSSGVFLGRWKLGLQKKRKRKQGQKMFLVVLYQLKNSLKFSKMLQGVLEYFSSLKICSVADISITMFYFLKSEGVSFKEENISFFMRGKKSLFLIFGFCARGWGVVGEREKVLAFGFYG